MARDWRWEPASFDGARFYVDAQEIPGGRRLVVHEYANSERHDVEDLGRKAGTLEVTAYFVSETADADSALLRARLERGGPGFLTIPMFGTRQVRAQQWRPSWSKQALNFVGFQITFVEEGNAFAPIPLGLGEAQLAQLGGGLAQSLGAAISSTVASAPQSSYLRADMLREVSTVVAGVSSFRASTPLPVRVDSETKTALADAGKLARDPLSDPGELVGTVLTALDDIVAQHTTDNDVAGPIDDLDDLSAAALAARSMSLARWGVSPLVAIVPLAAALAYSGQASRLRAIRDYRDRATAQAARTKIGVASALLTPLYGALGVDAMMAFDGMIGLAARHISSRIPDLSPVVIVETGASLPSNVLAYRLYADPTRGRELAERNGVATPCFMPTRFEANAR
jgi:hypothetical protein